MRRPVTRWVVFVIAATIAAGLSYRAATLGDQGNRDRQALATASVDARALQLALSDARRALAAMASPGQPAVSWSRQVGSAIDTARTRLNNLAAVHGAASLSASNERFDQLLETEKRLREFAVGGRALQASDVAFGEALPHLDAIDGNASKLFEQLAANAEQKIAAAGQQQSLAVVGALATLALAALILTPLSRTHTADAEVPAPVVTPPVVEEPSLELARVVPPVPDDPPVRVPTPTVVSLSPLAAVCGELARLSNGAALSSVLERVAPAIGAKGIVVWLADADRDALHAAASWGYDRRLVERFPAVPVTDDNPTARAFTAGAPSIVPGRGGEPAAIATAIVGTKGTTGVLSVELASSGGVPADVVAVTAIVAAQLATLLEPLPRPEAPAEAAPAAQQA